jgi:predicted PurR-regulated permease PerM
LIDNILRTIIVSRKTKINSAIIIIGMIGGFFVFGVLGLIIGPLVLAYVLLVIEIYRKKNLKNSPPIFKECD